MHEYKDTENHEHYFQESHQSQTSNIRFLQDLDQTTTQLSQLSHNIHHDHTIIVQHDPPALVPFVGEWIDNVQPDQYPTYIGRAEHAYPHLHDDYDRLIRHETSECHLNLDPAEQVRQRARGGAEGSERGIDQSNPMYSPLFSPVPAIYTSLYPSPMIPPIPTLTSGHVSPVLSFDQPGSSSASFYSTTTSQASTTYDSVQQAPGPVGNPSTFLRPAHRLPARRTSATPKRQAEKRRREAKICYCELCPRYKSDGTLSQYKAFTRRDTLARHFRTEHDANASGFRCSMCTFIHRRSDKIVRHIRASHPGFEYPIVVRHLVEEVQPQLAEIAEDA